MNFEVVVVGAGLVGASIAYGLVRNGIKVLVVDGGDRDHRASNANMGLIWVQGKGLDMPPYQQLTRDSAGLWPTFGASLTDATAIDLQYENKGGVTVCVGEAEFEARRAKMLRLHNQLGCGEADWEMLDRDALRELLPNVRLGPEVTGASFSRRDGHANPLRLLSALHKGIVRKGGQLRGGVIVRSVQKGRGGEFLVDLGDEKVSAVRVVIAAGLGSKALAAQVGLDIPIRPQRGQILVTERLEPFLPIPLHSIRQTREGTVMIGATIEEVGLDSSTTTEAAAAMSAKVISCLPALAGVKLVRQWAGLRIMTPDSYPIYAESQSHPGAFVAVCHSGVTLAAIHATRLADAIALGSLPPFFDAFNHRRFDVPKVA